MKNSGFKERLYFNDKMVFILLGAGIVGALLGLFKSIRLEQITIGHVIAYLSFIVLSGFLFWWLKRLTFKVSVNEKRIKYKMSPIHKKARRIGWDEVESCQIIKTSPAAQWHGGNLRFGRESWFSLTGRNGLSIETKDGRRLFIGCKDVDELVATLDRFPSK